MTRMTAPLLLLAWLAADPAQAARSYDNCTGFVDSVPAVINSQGTWCLRKDASTTLASGAALEVSANNVILDCNDFKLGGLAAGPATGADGVRVTAAMNVTIRNCTIRGFRRAIAYVQPAGGGHMVESNRIEGSTIEGIHLEGNQSTVRDNLVLDTGGNTPTSADRTGIATFGDGNNILDNSIDGVTSDTPTTYRIGIYFATGSAGTGNVGRNRISGMGGSATGTLIGIFVPNPGSQIIHDNNLQGPGSSPDYGIFGIYCPTSQSTARGNILAGFPGGAWNCLGSDNVVNTN